MKKVGALFVLCFVFLIGSVSAVCPSGIASYWGFDGNAQDVLGANNGVNHGASFVSGRVGQAGSFSGSQYFQIEDSNSLDLTGHSIEAWFNIGSWPSTNGEVQTILMKGEDSVTDGWNYGMYLTKDSLYQSGNPSIVCTIESANSPADNTQKYLVYQLWTGSTNSWNHVVCTLEGTIWKMYVNGADVTTSTKMYNMDLEISSLPAGFSPKANTAPLYIGAERNDGGVTGYLNGKLDGVAIYNRALSASEISQNYNGGTGQNLCSSNNQAILKLSSPTNAHGALWNDPTYTYSIDYNNIFGQSYTGTDPHVCNGTNRVLWLSADTNAHASTENIGGTETQTTVTNPSFMYTITHDGDSSAGSVDCINKESPGAGYALVKRECLKDNGQRCLSDVCFWYKSVTDYVRDYTITRGSTACDGSAPAGYSLQKRECLFEEGGSCIVDLCLWYKQVTDSVRDFTINRGNPNIEGQSCSNEVPAGYTLKNSVEAFNVGGSISDLCLWQKVLGNAQTITTTITGGSYNTRVCYGGLVCTPRQNTCLDNEKMVVALYEDNDTHISDPNYFPSGVLGAWRLDGNANDSSGTNNGINNGASFVSGKVGKAASFNGADSYINISNSNSLKSSVFTYSAWINPSVVGGSNRTILSNGVYESPRIIIDGNRKLALLKTNILEIGHSNVDLPTNVWTYVTVTYDSLGNYAFYINGELSGSGTNSVPLSFTNSFFEIGRDSSISSEYFSGLIDEVSIYNRVLTQDEIQNLYNQGMYELKICCKPGSGAAQAYWANMDGARTNFSWLDGSVKLVSDVAGGTYIIEKYDNVLIGDDWTSVATLTAAAGKNYATWKTSSSGIYRFKINGLVSDELNVNNERTTTNPTIEIVEPACGNDYGLGQTITFVINVSDPKDLVVGNVTLGDGSSREIENGLNSFTYNYTTKGTKQIIAQVVDSTDGRNARAVTNIILLNLLENDLFIAACIESPKNLQKFDGSQVTFNSSTTRALNYTAGVGKTEVSDDSLTFNWTLSDIGSDRVYCTFKGQNHSCTHSATGPMMVSQSTDIKGYHFTWTFPSSGDNWAGLVVDL